MNGELILCRGQDSALQDMVLGLGIAHGPHAATDAGVSKRCGDMHSVAAINQVQMQAHKAIQEAGSCNAVVFRFGLPQSWLA
jgi:hypothetical protein